MPQISKQELFDRVAAHLLTQRERCMDADGACAYRGHDGMRCAVGIFIQEDKYKPEFEGENGASVLKACGYNTGTILGPLFGNPSLNSVTMNKLGRLVRQLQVTHDDYPLEDWKVQLASIARAFKLDPSILEKYDAITTETEV